MRLKLSTLMIPERDAARAGTLPVEEGVIVSQENVPWQIQLFRKSLKKRIKWGILEGLLPSGLNGQIRCLDLGCAKGTFSYLLNGRGGAWVSADLDLSNLEAAKTLVGPSVCRLDYRAFPFADHSMDMIVSLDFLEHVHEDDRCLREFRRILKPGGTLILSTPATGKMYLANRLRRLAGLGLEDYGHVREGYTLLDLTGRLRALGFVISHESTYSRFFTEVLEMTMNAYYARKARRRESSRPRDGGISPGSEADFKAMGGMMKLYSVVYPILWGISRLDALLAFTSGYALMIAAVKGREAGA
jgi:SAM-dependent methyltransferase